VPDPRHLPDLEQFSTFESVALFVERAMAVRPDFAVTGANAPAIAEICVRLDGLPLAIELAAARVRVLSPQAIMDRLGDRMALLSSGSRDLPERQQTLRGAIAWSHELLDEADRRVFARLAVFAGGATLDAVGQVVLDPGERGDPLDAVASLVDKSLARQESEPDGEPRFRMLETIREYAMEKLTERGEAEMLRERHAAWVVSLVEGSAPRVFGEEQRPVLDRYELEHDNIRAALAWAIDGGHTETALRILAASWRFWQMRGFLAEARESAERVLALPGSEELPDARAAALEAGGGIAYWQADIEASRAWYGEALELARASGDLARIANAVYNMGFTYSFDSDNPGDAAHAREIAAEAVGLYRQLGDEGGIARALWGLSTAQFFLRDYQQGIALANEALEIFRRLGDRFMTAWALYILAVCNLTVDKEAMRSYLEDALPIFVENDDKSGYALLFDAFATLEWANGDVSRAMRLAGYAAATERSAGTGLAQANRDVAGFSPESLSDDPANGVFFAEGQRLDLEQATALALHRA
jgi:tetratricopeptide (TPR) repeat protein